MASISRQLAEATRILDYIGTSHQIGILAGHIPAAINLLSRAIRSLLRWRVYINYINCTPSGRPPDSKDAVVLLLLTDYNRGGTLGVIYHVELKYMPSSRLMAEHTVETKPPQSWKLVTSFPKLRTW